MADAKWSNSDDLLAAIQEAHERLRLGKTDVATANAESRIFTIATRVLGVQLDHAKSTGRLREGSDRLPGFTLERPLKVER